MRASAPKLNDLDLESEGLNDWIAAMRAFNFARAWDHPVCAFPVAVTKDCKSGHRLVSAAIITAVRCGRRR